MRTLLTGDDLFSEILMRRTSDARTVIVLEGPSDCVIIDNFIDDGSSYSIDANGKASVARVIECCIIASMKRVLGVVDNDAEMPADWPNSEFPIDLVWTGLHDLDAEVLYAGSVFERTIAAYGDREKVKSSTRREKLALLEQIVAPISQLGHLSKERTLGFSVVDHPVHASIEWEDGRWTVNVRRMVTIAKGKSVQCQADVDSVVGLVKASLAGSTAPVVLNGHRLFDGLAFLLNNHWGSLRLTGTSLERVARAALTFADLKTTVIYDRISEWGRQVGSSIWIER